MKRNSLNYQTISYQGVELVLAYTVDGKFIPATQYDPAEYPEVEIQEVLANSLNIMPIFLDSQIDDLYELLNNCEL